MTLGELGPTLQGIGTLISAISALAAYISSRMNAKKLEEVKHTTNGLAQRAENYAKAEGKLEGIEIGRAENGHK